jgi:hypothetical protein
VADGITVKESFAEFDSQTRELVHGLPDTRQPRMHVGPEFETVEADHGDVAGDRVATGAEFGDDGEGDDVVAGDDRRRAVGLGSPVVDDVGAVVLVVAPAEDDGADTARGGEVGVGLVAVVGRVGADDPGGVSDGAVPQAEEVLESELDALPTTRLVEPYRSSVARSTRVEGATMPNGEYMACMAVRYPAVGFTSFSVVHSTSRYPRCSAADAVARASSA